MPGDLHDSQAPVADHPSSRTIALQDSNVNVLALPSKSTPQILCASQTPFAIDLKTSDDFRTEQFDSFRSPVHAIFRSAFRSPHPLEAFLAADADRYLQVFHIGQKKLIHTLIARSEVLEADFYTPSAEEEDRVHEQMLAVVTKDGCVELFPRPFSQPQMSNLNGDLKSKRKLMTRKSAAQIRLIQTSSSGKQIPAFNASLQGPELLVAIASGGVDISFQKIRWQDEGTGELLFDGTKDVVCRVKSSILNTVTTNGVKDTSKSHLDESKVVVVEGGLSADPEDAVISISSGESDSEGDGQDEDDEDDEENGEKRDQDDEEDEVSSEEAEDADADLGIKHQHALEEVSPADVKDTSHSAASHHDEEMHDPALAEKDEDESPTFGELVASREQALIPIPESFIPESTAVTASQALAAPSGISLATVLTQSLRTNDLALLESCLHTTDIDVVKNTIRRLDSSLAGILLQKLAERLSSRPGRAGHLLTWVQWTCISHGGALAAQPDAANKIRTLYRVLTQRAKCLDHLLLLKGKLDMLDAQIQLRKQLRAERGSQRDAQDEPNTVYIEGHDNWTSSEDDDDKGETRQPPSRATHKSARRMVEPGIEDFAESESDDEAAPLPNGIAFDSESEGEGEDDFEGGVSLKQSKKGVVEDEADEEQDDEGESIADDFDDDDDDESDGERDEDEDEAGASSMEDFIDDDSVSNDASADDEETHTPQKPPTKRLRRH